MNRQPRIWIVAERPVRLPNALIAAEVLRERFPGGCCFVRDQSPIWDRVQWQRYVRYFDEVYIFPQVRACRGLRDLPRLYRQIRRRKIDIAALSTNPDTDVLLCIAGVMGLANVAATTHPNARKVLSISASSYARLTRPVDADRFRFSTSGWLQNRVVEPLAGVERTLNLRLRVDPGGDGTRLVRLQRTPDEIFDTIVIASINGREVTASGNARFISACYPSVAELSVLSESTSSDGGLSKRVLFFGTPFLLVQNLAPKVYVEHANRCLDFIRRNYPGRDLIYRPHPFETKESNQLNLNGFRLESDGKPAELYFLERFREIEAVFSVSSTVSRRAMTFGLNAYAFWRCFPFSETASRFFKKLMGEVPADFEIRGLAQAPIEYQSMRTIEPVTRSYGEALKEAMDLVVTIS